MIALQMGTNSALGMCREYKYTIPIYDLRNNVLEPGILKGSMVGQSFSILVFVYLQTASCCPTIVLKGADVLTSLLLPTPPTSVTSIGNLAGPPSKLPAPRFSPFLPRMIFYISRLFSDLSEISALPLSWSRVVPPSFPHYCLPIQI